MPWDGVVIRPDQRLYRNGESATLFGNRAILSGVVKRRLMIREATIQAIITSDINIPTEKYRRLPSEAMPSVTE